MGQDERALRYIDLALAGLGVFPSLIVSVRELLELRARIERGEDVTLEELDAKLARMEQRSARIQGKG